MTDEIKNNELVAQLEEIMASGTEAQAREFIIAHLAEFPVETQRQLAVGLFSDALDTGIAGQDELTAMKEKAAAAIDESESDQS